MGGNLVRFGSINSVIRLMLGLVLIAMSTASCAQEKFRQNEVWECDRWDDIGTYKIGFFNFRNSKLTKTFNEGDTNQIANYIFLDFTGNDGDQGGTKKGHSGTIYILNEDYYFDPQDQDESTGQPFKNDNGTYQQDYPYFMTLGDDGITKFQTNFFTVDCKKIF